MKRRSTLSTCACETFARKLSLVVGGFVPTGRVKQPAPPAAVAVSAAVMTSHLAIFDFIAELLRESVYYFSRSTYPIAHASVNDAIFLVSAAGKLRRVARIIQSPCHGILADF